MIAYNSQSLDNLHIREEVEKAVEKDCITATEQVAVNDAHPVDLYMPNFYLRIGIFILTAVILLFSFGLFCMVVLGGRRAETVLSVLCFLFGVGAYFLAEYMVREKKHYKSGADAALLWGAGIALLSGLGMADLDAHMWGWCFITLLISLYFVLRFADVSMSIVAHLALLGFCFFIFENMGGMAKVIIPFVVIFASLGVYLLSVKLSAIHTYRHYQRCLQVLQLLSLITLYIGGNYFVVRELSIEMFNLDLQPGQDIAGGWLFWILTVVLPLTYIGIGIRKKDRILLGVGLLLIAAMVCTIRYYHSIAPLEVAMTLGGIGMIAVAYGLIRYLKQPRHGFTADSADERHTMEALQIESLVISQTMSHAATPAPDQFQFGGGSGGGGGASGEY